MIHLQVGVLQPDRLWWSLLEQAGLFLQEIHQPEQLEAPHQWPLVVVANGTLLPDAWKPALQGYLQGGGMLLVEADLAARFWGEKTARRKIKFAFSEPGEPFFPIPLVDVEGELEIVQSARWVGDQSGNPIIGWREEGNGAMMVFPSGLISRLRSREITRRQFPARRSPRFPSERVARINRQGIRILLERAVQFLVHQRGLPVAIKWPFPQQAAGLFLFRIDTDFATPQQLESLYSLLSELGIRATWFVETATARNHLPVFQNFCNQEIGLHCFRHRIFATVEENQQDMLKGLEVLARIGVRPMSYAAPYGEWNPALARAVAQAGFVCASEFGLAYDDRPFGSPRCGDDPPVLQIPIHPLSVRRLRLARLQPAHMVDYFCTKLAELNSYLQHGALYHHPGQGLLEVWREVFQRVDELGWPNWTFAEYARWWCDRLNWHIQPVLKENQVVLIGENRSRDFSVGICWPDGRWEILAGDGARKCLWSPPSWEPPETPPAQLRQPNWRLLVQDVEFYLGKRKR